MLGLQVGMFGFSLVILGSSLIIYSGLSRVADAIERLKK